MKASSNNQNQEKDNSSINQKKSIIKIRKSMSHINFSRLQITRNENKSSNRGSFIQNSKSLSMDQKNTRNIDQKGLIFDSPYLKSKQRNYNLLCNDLKSLEIQNRNKYQSNNNFLDIDKEEEFDFANMQNNLKLNDTSPDYNNIVEIMKIVGKVKIPREKGI